MLAFLLVENIAVRPDQRGRGIGDKPLRAGRALLNCVKIYTNAIRTSNLRPSWVPGIPTGDDCTEQHGRSHEEVNQDPFSGPGRHHQFAECPLREVVIRKLWGS